MNKRLGLGICVGVASLWAVAAEAQTFMPAVIGATVGNSMSSRAPSEEACQNGVGLPPEPWPSGVAAQVDELVEQFAEASLRNDVKTIKRLFAGGRAAGVAGLDGVPSAPGAGLPGWTGEHTLKRTQLVIATDALHARSTWVGEGSDLVYTIDFRRNLVWNTNWRIMRVRASTASDAPQLPAHFCHLTDIAALW